jgi:transcription elongation GreA/GreB family factor
MAIAILHRLLASVPSRNCAVAEYMGSLKEDKNERCVCREESAEAAQEVSLPPRAISPHPNLVTQSGLRALEQALAESRQALKTAQAIEDANARRRALELAARDARYFAERLASAVPQPEPLTSTTVAFGSRVEILRDDGRRQTFRIVGEDEADPRAGSIAYVSPLAHHLIGKQIGEAVEMDGHEIEIVGCSSEQDCS